MDKELCFSIENTDLYLEQVLVDYMNVPMFFLCKGEAQYYLALCTKISMRDAVLKQREYWDIVSGDEIYLDEVTKKHIEEVDLDTLPEKGACFKALTKQKKLYVQKFDREFYK